MIFIIISNLITKIIKMTSNMAIEFYERDCNMNLDQNQLIIDHLKKLDYYELSSEKMIELTFKEKFIEYMSNNVNICFTDLNKSFTSDEEYNSYIHTVNKHIKNSEMVSFINNDTSKMFFDWMNKFILTEEYKTTINNINDKCSRCTALSVFIGTNNTQPFYEALTDNELYYLGY